MQFDNLASGLKTVVQQRFGFEDLPAALDALEDIVPHDGLLNDK